MKEIDTQNWLDTIVWNQDGLVPVITQDLDSGKVLMFAWMNREALQLTVEHKRAVYWSRSRNKLWFKGEESSNIQFVKEIRLDCDNDVLLLKVEQKGGIACHTGRMSCFYKKFENNQWIISDPVLKEPAELYRKK